MIAIASLLDMHANQQIEGIWDWLEENCGLSEIKLTPLPHFSWQTAEVYDIGLLEAALQELAASLSPFSVRTAGIGIFTGEIPVLYLALVKNKQLLALHEMIWKRILPYSQGINEFYAPKYWMPHISLAYGDVTPGKLACALEGMLHTPLVIDVAVDNLSVIYHIGGFDGVKSRFDFRSVSKREGLS